MNNPEPIDELPPAEIRGGNKPEDYIPTLPATQPLDIEEAFDDEPLGGNDPDVQ